MLPAQDDPGIFDLMPPIVKAILRRYTKINDQISISTPVFSQVDADSDGIVEYHDFLDSVTHKNRELFNLADITVFSYGS